ncbi:hypothetical protein GCM10009789_47050 [Kribbella sancticallisti]|uniref:Secreted protein n=1 Tax=Kribbella sancticallisti TaxID=460087 RepID=A0ABP4PQ48_9ACTN
MGAPIWILVMVIVAVLVGYLLWTLFAAGRGAVAAAKSVEGKAGNETAAHSSERTADRSVEHTPPPGAVDQTRDEGARQWSEERQVNEQGMAEDQPDRDRRTE